ncbi:MAG: Stp1/IreP family PP2C-type Ser/Thr phosphatase [Firmicutes bacterium]|nr:Stp1/IreP family PP2C-type Ser/Thr phosphatase [Bacillota bacterium]
MQYKIYTNIGKVRNDNEDSYLLKMEPYPLIAVADGMGGHSAGEIASKLAVDFINEYNFVFQNNLLKEIEDSINAANMNIHKLGNQQQEYRDMGTTLSMGIIYQNSLYIGHVGDSRIYLFRDNTGKQLTTDHSLVNQLLENNQITYKEAFNHPQRHIITQALGTSSNLKVETKKVSLQNNDILLFCTDGLSDMVKFNIIEELYQSHSNLKELSNNLGEKALENGGNDNITFILFQV